MRWKGILTLALVLVLLCLFPASGANTFQAGYLRDAGGAIVVNEAGAGTYVNATAATAAGGAITATCAATATTTTYITGFTISTTTGTAGVVTATLTGVQSGPLSYAVATPTTGANVVTVTFPWPVPATAVNTTVVVSLPATGGVSAVNTIAATCFQI